MSKVLQRVDFTNVHKCGWLYDSLGGFVMVGRLVCCCLMSNEGEDVGLKGRQQSRDEVRE